MELKDFSVKDRNYDSNYKTESVTVEVRAENADSAYEVAYAVVGQSPEWRLGCNQCAGNGHNRITERITVARYVDSVVAATLQEKEKCDTI